MRGIAKRILRGKVIALLTMAWVLSGCEPTAVTVLIPGFGDGSVDGIWLWRQSGGTYQRTCRLEFSPMQLARDGHERIQYLQLCEAPNQLGMDLQARIERLPEDPSTVIVELWYFRYEPGGRYRASAYNTAGESPLSSTSLDL